MAAHGAPARLQSSEMDEFKKKTGRVCSNMLDLDNFVIREDGLRTVHGTGVTLKQILRMLEKKIALVSKFENFVSRHLFYYSSFGSIILRVFLIRIKQNLRLNFSPRSGSMNTEMDIFIHFLASKRNWAGGFKGLFDS